MTNVVVQKPTITAVSPNSGSALGGTSVTITGTNFAGATAVKFGGTPAKSFTVKSATMIIAVSPVDASGTVDVTVTTRNGTNSPTKSDQFTFVMPQCKPGNGYGDKNKCHDDDHGNDGHGNDGHGNDGHGNDGHGNDGHHGDNGFGLEWCAGTLIAFRHAASGSPATALLGGLLTFVLAGTTLVRRKLRREMR